MHSRFPIEKLPTLDQTSVTPTPEQQRVIHLPPRARAVVVAGPGSGKTWTLLARATHLIRDDDLDASEVLVLSFTRAVVGELRKRSREPGSARILPETFDAFASRMLRENDPDGDWARLGFDGRIRRAAALLDGDGLDALRHVRHILVDEIQDLAGPRADLVDALLGTTEAGWTAFGDPAQAIYEGESVADDASLTDRLSAQADERIVLTGNHRCEPAVASELARLGSSLIAGESGAGDAVWGAFHELDTLGSADELGVLLRGARADCAVLCRDNAVALGCSELLHRSGVSHRVRRGTTNQPVPGWLAAVARGRTTLTRAHVEEAVMRLNEFGFPSVPDVDEAWRALTRLDARARSGGVRVSEVAARVGSGRLPWELLAEQDAQLTVSTIHRAKGLEFDACCIVEWKPRDVADPELEARVLYVALSRARGDRFQVAAPQWERWYRSGPAGGRFVKSGFQRWQTFGIEIRGDDAHAVDPAGTVVDDVDPIEAQDLMTEQVRPGDSVTLRFAGAHALTSEEVPVYSIHHACGPIGVTGAAFGRDLTRQISGDRRPAEITGVRVEDLETVRGDADVAEMVGLGSSGLWLRPRIIGLGRLEWG